MSAESQSSGGLGGRLTCDECQRTFDTEQGLRTHLGMVHGTKIADRICVECEEPFRGKPRRKYCSPDCSERSQRNRVEVECGCCYKPITRKKSLVDRSESNYCSDRCNGLSDRTHFGYGDKLRRYTRPNNFRELVRHAYCYEAHSFEATCRIVNTELEGEFAEAKIEGVIEDLKTHERNVRNRVWALRPEDLGLSPKGEVA